ncbi:homoserine kinase [Nakamurella sp. YIM 132087]|uniref:Homoserine kinase n=1 Tax=Nakamurella alba TaxID=2665158 RepID=A0A7K1FHN1_9ACTN|nr:homoserine kinase [Nakamurella alba]MTD13637.1 homoserine kinase [Nakamurella alba]
MTDEQVTGRVTVRVPATSANLGPGYDSFGLALTRYDEVSAVPAEGISVEVQGVGAGEVPTDESHLVVRAALRAFAAAGAVLPGFALTCRNTIPHGGGQGSSAAAVVAGLLLGRAMLPDPTVLTDRDVLELGTEMEGHPDNVAPALFGGFTMAWTAATDGRPSTVRKQVHPDVRAHLFSADRAASTHYARSLLPPTVPHADAAANTAAAALLVHALTAEPALLLEATEDRLHQQYRAPAMPETAALVAALRDAGIAAVVSGAGPSVLALTDLDISPEPFARNGFEIVPVQVDTIGAVVTTG